MLLNLLHVLFNLKAVPVRINAEVKVGYPPVDKMEDVCAWSTVELSFDFLRVCVRGELLASVLCHKKQRIVLGV